MIDRNLPNFTRRILFVAIIAMLFTIILACGGGDESGEQTTPTTEVSNSTGSSNTGNSEGISIGGSGNSTLDCSAITAVASLSASAISAFTSTAPESELSGQVHDFFKELLEEGLDIEATSTCFFEASVEGEGGGVWIEFILSREVGAADVAALTRELASRQIEIVAFGELARFLESLSVVEVEQVPGAPEGTHGAVMLTGNTALVLAGSD